MATGVCVARCQKFIFFKNDFYRFGGLNTLVSVNKNLKLKYAFRICDRRYCSGTQLIDTSSTSNDDSNSEDVTIRFIRGLPQVTVPLPSRNEKCQFTLKPISHSVGDFLAMLKFEDRGIDRATILNFDGVRISSACSIGNLMDEDFWLHVNDKKYLVKPPKREQITTEEITKLGDVQALVAQLYEALHVGEHQIQKEKELNEKLEDLNMKLGPLEDKKSEFEVRAVRKTNVLTWVGLGLMSVQFGILARLTWWEYSWDIMEPVTYFVTYGTAMAAYAYYVLTKQEYNLPDVRDRQYLITMHKRAKKGGLDLDEYNVLKKQIAEVEYDLKRLRDPLQLHLPSNLIKQTTTPTSNFDDLKALVSSKTNLKTGIQDLFSSVKNRK